MQQFFKYWDSIFKHLLVFLVEYSATLIVFTATESNAICQYVFDCDPSNADDMRTIWAFSSVMLAVVSAISP